MKAFTIGMAAPGLLAVALCADLCSRFVSYTHVSFRVLEAVNRNGGTGFGGPFPPSERFKIERAYGDLAAMGNAPALRQYRTEVMTTDQWGFRNAPGTGDGDVDAVLFGTSFSVGAALSDDQMLSRRLEKHIGMPVYNGAGMDIGREREVTRLISRLHFHRRIAIVEYMEGVPPPSWAAPPTLAMRLEDRFGDRYRALRRGYSHVKGWLNESPLKLALFKMFKGIQNDVILPNAFSDRVFRDELSNGDPILFLPSQIAPRRGPSAVGDTILVWRHVDDFFRAEGFDLLVVLVPSQYHVYGPLVKHPLPTVGDDTYLDDLERGLRAAGIACLSLGQPLKAAARDELSAHRYVYWRDDTHWNAAGVEIAAREIASQLGHLHAAPRTAEKTASPSVAPVGTRLDAPPP